MKYQDIPTNISGIYKINFPIRKTRRTIPLTQEEIVKIKKELLNKNFSIKDIAKHFNCSTDTISDINLGKRYNNVNESYPIRTFYPNRGSKKPVSTILESEE
jgi:DNA invertase Pin-like site-specific DNA recombinase